MAVSPNGADRINLFALVVYIPDPLAKYLDDLRHDMVPGCIVRAHVTMLPPRPLSSDPADAIERAREVLSRFAPFEIEPGEIEVFPKTDVIYIGIKKGDRELRQIYRALNGGSLAFREEFSYHPHITLAQGLQPDKVQSLAQAARDRWAEFPYSRTIPADRACFVQSTVSCTWADLAEFRLGAVPLSR
jgi:2'-5' RNA ligase